MATKTDSVANGQPPAHSHADIEKQQALHQEHSHVLDDEKKPATAAVDYSGAAAKTDPEEIRLVRKLDLWIMPTLWVMYWLKYANQPPSPTQSPVNTSDTRPSYLDRNAIALARLNGLEEQLGLTSVQYSTCVSILFVGYILGQIPSNMILTRVRPSWYMGGFMAAWAVVSALTAVVHDYTGLVLARFFLGVVEAPYYPGALYILSIFYTRKELATRISVLYSGNILATAFAGLIAAGVFHGLEGVSGLAGWRWLFVLQGAVTFAVALVACYTLPDEPLTTRWLSEAERRLAHARIARDTVGGRPPNGSGSGSSTWAGLREAVVDPRVWVFVYMQHMHLATNGFKNFFPTIVETLGFGTTVTLVLTCPPYLIAGGLSIAWAWSSGRHNERTWHITIAKAVALFGFVLACATMNTGARYFAMVVFTIGTYGVNSILLGWVGSTCGQTKEKKASALAVVNTSASLSFIWTPYLWPKSDAPRYVIPMASSAAFCVACAAGAWLMRWMLVRENRRIRRSDQEATLFYAY
ncbi:major facilitator superfamily transporter [Colletotrichum higginsianum]|nr:major facilitator superfamily transporter [Colletotrichum higginsianum]